MSQILSTPSFEKPSYKFFAWQKRHSFFFFFCVRSFYVQQLFSKKPYHFLLGELFVIYSLMDMHQGDPPTKPFFMLPIFVCYGVLQRFFFLTLSFPLLLTLISLPALLLVFLFLSVLFINWLLWGLWSNLANAWLGHLFIFLLTSLLLLIFVALRTISRFCESCLNLFIFPFY